MDQLAHTRSIYFPFCLVEKTRILLKTDAYVPYYVFGRPASYSQSSSMHSTDNYILKKPSNVVLRPAAYTYTQTVRDTVCSCTTCPEEKRSYSWIGQKYTVYILYMQQVPLARLVVSLGSSACMCTCIYYMYTHGALFLKKASNKSIYSRCHQNTKDKIVRIWQLVIRIKMLVAVYIRSVSIRFHQSFYEH